MIGDRAWEALARVGEEALRGRRQRAGERMTVNPDGSVVGLGPPPGPLRTLVEKFAALEELQTPADLERARAVFLENYIDGPFEEAARQISWPMIVTARGG